MKLHKLPRSTIKNTTYPAMCFGRLFEIVDYRQRDTCKKGKYGQEDCAHCQSVGRELKKNPNLALIVTMRHFIQYVRRFTRCLIQITLTYKLVRYITFQNSILIYYEVDLRPRISPKAKTCCHLHVNVQVRSYQNNWRHRSSNAAKTFESLLRALSNCSYSNVTIIHLL